jgi:hypothetical protein
MACVGGIALERFREKSRLQNGTTRVINRVNCDPVGFYDTQELASGARFPAMPDAFSASTHSSVSDMASSNSLSSPPPPLPPREEPLPLLLRLLDYAGESPPPGMDALIAMVADSGVSTVRLDDLLHDRYHKMQSLASFKARHGVFPEHIAAHKGAAVETFEAWSMGTVPSSSPEPLSPQTHHAAHMVAHWIVRQHILGALPAGGAVWRWFAECEAHLVLLHTRFAIPATAPLDTLVAALAPVIAQFDLSAVRDSDVPEHVRAAAADASRVLSPGAPGNSAWYSLNAVDALMLGVTTLRNGARRVYVDPATQQLMLSVTQIADDLLPLFVDACIRCSAGAAPPPHPDVAEAVAAILADRADHVAQQNTGAYLPRDNVDPRTLPHLENTSAPGAIYPLCMQRVHWKLTRGTGHLKDGERVAYAGFLLDLGYSPQAIEEHVHQNALARGMSQTDVKSVYAGMARRKEAGMWENGVRTRPYGAGCQKKITGGDGLPGDVDKANPDMCVACPYARLHATTLRAELLHKHGTGLTTSDIEDIVSVAIGDRNAQGACAAHFTKLYGAAPPPNSRMASWRPRAPRAFAQEALSRIREVVVRTEE